MRVLVAVLMLGIAGCGGGSSPPGEGATPSSPAIFPAKSEQKSAAKKAVEGQEPLTLKGHSDLVISVSFSPDGKRIVSGSFDNTLKVWDISSLATSM